MKLPVYFNSKKSASLYGIVDHFHFLKNLYVKNGLPKVLMLSGKKGSGKSTLINHLMFYIFDKKNYDEKIYEFDCNSTFYIQFLNDIFSNIFYLSGSNYKNVSIEDIRNLKIKIHQTSIADLPRFIILDDVELFNNNSLSALLKIIEEPSKNNYFLLINNKSKPLIDTIKSRCLEIKIILDENKRLTIIDSLIKKFKISSIIDTKNSYITPGEFIKFNYLFSENKITLDGDYLKNLGILLNLYKKNKDSTLIDMILFLTNYYFNSLKNNNEFNNDKIIKCKSFVFESINDFFLYNLNQNAVLNNIYNKINNE